MPIKKKRRTKLATHPTKTKLRRLDPRRAVLEKKKAARKKQVVSLLKKKKEAGFPKGYKPKSGERFPKATFIVDGKKVTKKVVKYRPSPKDPSKPLPEGPGGYDPGGMYSRGLFPAGLHRRTKISEPRSLLVPKVKPASKGYLNDLDAAAWKISSALKHDKTRQVRDARRAKKKGKDPVRAATRRKILGRATSKTIRHGFGEVTEVGRARELKKRLMTIAKRAKKVESVLAKRKTAIKAKVAKKKTTSRKK
tara:strand:- start:4 stop:756 length:753 start_codon:yes stop_codon:yes gene_type:complete